MIGFNDAELLAVMRPDLRNVVRSLENPPGELMTPLQMIEFNSEHAKRFMAGDFEGIMNQSLIDEPVYEFYPSRIRISGKEAVHRYHEINYHIVIAQVDPKRRITPAEQSLTLSRTFGDNTYGTEVSGIFKLGDGDFHRCYFNAVIPFQDGKMVGERVWMDERLSDFFVSGLEADGTFFDLPGAERF